MTAQEDRPAQACEATEVHGQANTSSVAMPSVSSSTAVYGSRPIKRRRFTRAELAALDDVIVEVLAEEHPASVRSVYYRCVSRGVVSKTEAEYRRISRRLVELRSTGRVPYWWIVDGTRLIRTPNTHDSAEQALRETADFYRRRLWNDQPVEVIILSEKDAISGTIWETTDRYQVELSVTRGYTSVTFVHSMAESIMENTSHGKTTFVYQLGDHDPSGVDAWRSFQERLREFAPGGEFECSRLAVTPEQIEELHLLTRPTKTSDSRSAGFSGESVEVDAIPPTELRRIVEEAITRHIDPVQLEFTKGIEERERDLLTAMAGNLGRVA